MDKAAFYITGGTLRHDSPSYVERKADRELLDGLLEGEFCYVLTSRQMGKSSLMVRTANKLREQSVTVVVLDLTAIGRPDSKEQWYFGLLSRLGTQTALEDELDKFWRENERLGPVQRFFTAVHKVLLTNDSGPVVIFVDELDVVRSLSFSTDEFFAAIRESYTRRTGDKEFDRLTFCLLGVATPSDLIRDSRITPFNIGRRIELNDFTVEEAAPLAKGLPVPQLLDRILYWTNGHPYLTQRLCQAVAQDGVAADEACTALFFSARARERDDNLIFVRERLLHSEVDQAALLHLYEEILGRKTVVEDDTNPLISVLRLAGVVRSGEGILEKRNRIYERAFGREWIRMNMPDAELRRQRTAFWRGVLRTSAIAAVLLALVSASTVITWRQWHRGKATARELRQNLYVADMKMAQVAFDEGNLGRAAELVKRYAVPQVNEEDLRGFDWRYLWSLCRGDEISTLSGHQNAVSSAVFSPDDSIIATTSRDTTLKLWNLRSRAVRATFEGFPGRIDYHQNCVAFSPCGALLAVPRPDSILILDAHDLRKVHEIPNAAPPILFSPDGRTFAARGLQTIKIWNTNDWGLEATFPAKTTPTLRHLDLLAYLPESKTIIIPTSDGEIEFWDISNQIKIGSIESRLELPLGALALSPTGRFLAAGNRKGTVRLWTLPRREILWSSTNFQTFVYGLAFSPDEQRLAVSGGEQVIHVLDVLNPVNETILRGHRDEIWSVRFSHEGGRLVSASKDGSAKIWTLTPRSEVRILTNSMRPLRFSSDSTEIVTVDTQGTISFWNVSTGLEIPNRRFSLGSRWTHGVYSISATTNGMLVSATLDHSLEVRDLTTSEHKLTVLQQTIPSEGVVISPSGVMLASYSKRVDSGLVTLWNLFANKVTDIFTNSIGPVAFSVDGKLLALCKPPYAAQLRTLSQNPKVKTLSGHKSWIIDIAFSPDGKLLGTASDDGTARLWHTEGAVRFIELKGHKEGLTSIAFHPDGRVVATGSTDDTVKLWNVRTGQELLTLRRFNEDIGPLIFSPDGNTLAVGSFRITGGRSPVQLWHVPSFTEIRAAEKSDWQ